MRASTSVRAFTSVTEAEVYKKKLIADAKAEITALEQGVKSNIGAKLRDLERKRKLMQGKAFSELEKQVEIEVKQLQLQLKEESKKKLQQAEDLGKLAIAEVEKRKKSLEAQGERIDASIKTLGVAAQNRKELGALREVMPDVYEAINLGVKVGVKAKRETEEISGFRAFKEAIKNPLAALSAKSASDKVKKLLEAELKPKGKDAKDINAVAQTKLVSSLIADDGLWAALDLQGPRMDEILLRYKEMIAEEVLAPSDLNNRSKIKLAKDILKNPKAISIIVKLIGENKEAVAVIIAESKALDTLFKKFGIRSQDINKLLPSLIKIIEALPEHRGTMVGIVNSLDVLNDLDERFKVAIDNLGKFIDLENIEIAPRQNKQNIQAILRNYKASGELDVDKLVIELKQLKIDNLPEVHKKKVADIISVLGAYQKSKEEITLRLLPGLRALMFSEKGISAQISQLLTDNTQAITALANNTQVVAALKKRGLSEAEVFRIMQKILPIMAQVLNNKKVAEKLVEELAKPGDVDAVRVQTVMPMVKDLLLGANGVVPDIVALIRNEKENFISLVIGAIKNDKELEARIRVATGIVDPKISIKDIARPLVAVVISILPEILDAKHHKNLIKVLDKIQSAKTKDGKLDFSNVEMGEIVKELMPILTDPKVMVNVSSLVTDANLKMLANNPSLKKYINEGSIKLLEDAAQSVTGNVEVVAKEFASNFQAINKVLRGLDNLSKGVFEDTDLTGQEVAGLARGALNVIGSVKPAELMEKHKETIESIVGVAIERLPDTTAGIKKSVLKNIVPKALPILMDVSKVLLDDQNLEKMKELTDNLAVILDDKHPQGQEEGKMIAKKKLDATFKITDHFIGLLKSDKFKEIYSKQIVPFLRDNKSGVAEVAKNIVKRSPEFSKYRIKGEEVVNIFSDTKTLKTLEEAYEAAKSGSYFTMIGKGIKALTQSKDVRSVVASAVVSAVRESDYYPNFLRRWTVGSRINAIIHENGVPDENGKVDLKNLFAEKAGNGLGALSYTLRSRTCRGLDFGALKFKNLIVQDFDLRETTHGNGNVVDLSGSTFKATKFDNCKLNGKIINLKDSTFGTRTFISLLPSLDEAIKSGKQIDAEGIKIVGLNKQDVEKIQGSVFGRRYLNQIMQQAPNEKPKPQNIVRDGADYRMKIRRDEGSQPPLALQ